MSRHYVTEAVMVAIYSELLAPSMPVQYIVPYKTIMELYEFQHSPDPLMNDPEDNQTVKNNIAEFISYLEEPLNRKKLERSFVTPWSKSPSIVIADKVTLTVINSYDNEQYGEFLDPIETELILIAQKEQAPILTDQSEFIHRIIQAEIPVRTVDINDLDI